TRNPRYWRAGLPYLDEITYRPIPDTVSREESLVAGTVDLLHSSNTQNVVDLMHRAGFTQVDDLHATSPPGQHCVMLNTAVAPTNDIRVRKALALATDAQRIIDVIYSGLTPPSNGPFAPGSPWYGPTGYPSYDPSGARALLRGYRADGGKASLTLGAVATSSALDTVELIQAMWEQVGIKVTLSSFEQATLIENAVLGRFQAYLWRDFEAADPDGIATSWRSADSRPPGSDALNFARNSDPLIDSALQRGRTSSTNGARAAAYQEVARRLAVDLPYVWLTRNVWIVAAGPGVMGLTDPALPGGGPALDMLAGVIWPSNLWRV
ncbi:MAG: ABC transporter substrate-binding protein, partial [Acidimicrobiales bacterium]